eukprot:CAMPEP_0115026060 /NCGR_PEP_ID=MMETSP0216-20121206/34469_1 /TAXON_ID=223996 /ORGANISM="Protocruzia adherens, Strain Boccale" /LENGTH=63 /DNA_ID=CAMNT_0002400959 /DNA_START=34 /DNA_END=221 /DNA_ORIENTATION=-
MKGARTTRFSFPIFCRQHSYTFGTFDGPLRSVAEGIDFHSDQHKKNQELKYWTTTDEDTQKLA